MIRLKSLLTEQSYSPIENYTESIEKIKTAVLKILEFTLSVSRDQIINDGISNHISRINRSTNTLLRTMKREDIPEPRYFEKFKSNVQLRHFYNYVKTRKLFGQDGNRKLAQACESIEKPGNELLKHIINNIKKSYSSEAEDRIRGVGHDISKAAAAQPGIKIPGNLDQALRMKQSYDFMQLSLSDKDKQLINDLDNGIDEMNKILPTIMVKR
jgi:uncharacterized protein YutE (UPF0331/DUF86 family)